MKLNFLSIKYFKTTIILLTSFLLFFAFRNFINFRNSEIPTMAIPKTSKIIKYDLNGDGTKDLIYLLAKDSKYHIEISINDKIYFLNEKRPLNTLGKYDDIAPLQLSFFDISRDNLSEIFIQSFDDNTPIQHIYTFENNEFKDIFCATNNTFGILNSKNNELPKYFSLDLNNITETLQKHMLINSTPKNISYDEIKIPGISTVQLLLEFITSEAPLGNVFFESAPSSIYKSLELIDKSENNYKLLDCFFIDTEWNSQNEVIKINWKIRLKEINISNNTSSNLLLNLTLEKTTDKFLISELVLKKDH